MNTLNGHKDTAGGVVTNVQASSPFEGMTEDGGVPQQKSRLERMRSSNKILILIVYVALFLDNMLMTTVVPIIPEYLFARKYPNETAAMLGITTAPKLTTTPEYYPGYSPIPMPITTTADPRFEAEKKKKHLIEENTEVGILFGSKALIQLITNPFIGPMTNRLGYTIPMFAGFVIMFISTLFFAFGSSYGVLFVARAFQGIGSACTSTSGMGMIAQRYPDDQARGAAMGLALGGLALGVLIGPPYGGLLYQFAGKELPFVLLAILAFLDGGLQFCVLQPKVQPGEKEATTMRQLIKDPYILIAAGAITVGNLGIAMLEPSLPLWMMDKMQARSLTRGAAFLPASISYLLGTNIFGPLAHRIGRWLSTLIGLLIIGCSLLAVPSATHVVHLILPLGFMGLAIGMIDASMFPQMGYLVDLRHSRVYGSIYAIADAAFCMAFAFGPYLSGPIVNGVGFGAMLYIIAFINFAYAPLLIFLRNPPQNSQETEGLIVGDECQLRYEQFEQDDVDEYYNDN